MRENNRTYFLVGIVATIMLTYFLLSRFQLVDDGRYYEGFAESLARGVLDFKSFYGFQGLSFFAVPVFWLTNSHNSVILTSIIFCLASIPLAYLVGRDLYGSNKAGLYSLTIFLLTPYPYVTLMRGFQEGALLFFVLLVVYGSIKQKIWTPAAWAVGTVVKPFALALFPLFVPSFLNKKRVGWLIIAVAIGLLYIGTTYHQTGHLTNDAAINSYDYRFEVGNPPPLVKSFTFGIKGFLRIGANLFIPLRKIMVSPLIILMGSGALIVAQAIKKRWNMIAVIILNILLVGLLTFSFSKYLLPMTTLLSLAAIYYLLKYRWLMILVFIDSIFVFEALGRYYSATFWPVHKWVFWLPYATAVLIYALIQLDESQNPYHSSDSQ